MSALRMELAARQSSADLSQNLQLELWPTIVFPRVLAFVLVILRFFARRAGGTRLWWDDWTVFVSTVG